MTNTDHVVMADITADVALVQCNHCGEQHCPSLPLPAALLADRLLGFVRMHRRCPKPLPPAKQVELFDVLVKREAERPGLPVPEDHAHEVTTYAKYETGHYAGFARRYPAPTTHEGLAGLLSTAFTPSQWPTADLVAWVKRLHPSSAVFQDTAHWARVERARAESSARAQRGELSEGGVTIPTLPPKPLKLQQALGIVAKGAKKKTKKSAREQKRKAKS